MRRILACDQCSEPDFSEIQVQHLSISQRSGRRNLALANNGRTACAKREPLRGVGFGAATGSLGGMVTDLLRVPNAGHMLVKAPPGIAAATLASASDNIADGRRTVAPHLAAWPGAPVLVLGGRAKSVSLYAVAAAVALRWSRVDYVDTNRERLAIAERLGATAVEAGRGGLRSLTGSGVLLAGGYPLTVDGCGAGGALDFALRALASGGMCTTGAGGGCGCDWGRRGSAARARLT